MAQKPTKQELKDKINTWANRAQMARAQGSEDLVQQALEHKRRYENDLAKLEEFDGD